MNAQTGTQALREVPKNIETEQALLGAILVNNQAFFRVADFLKPFHFFDPVHSQLFEVFSERIRNRHVVDPHTIGQFVPADLAIGDISLRQYIGLLASSATTVINASDYGLSIYDRYRLRRSISLGESLVERAYSAPMDFNPTDFNAEIIFELQELQIDPTKSRTATRVGGIVDEALNETAEAYQNKTVRGVDFPLKELDQLNHGPLESGNLYGLLGGTKEGKSSLTAMVIRKALDNGHWVLVLSYDQTGIQWVRQMAAQEIGLDANKQRKGQISEKEWIDLEDAYNRLRGTNLHIIKCGQENAERLCVYATRFCLEAKKQSKPVLIVTDHVGKITPDDSRVDAGKQAGQINQRFKAFAGKNDAVWFNLIQRNSAGASRKNPRPTKKDIYGSEGAVADYDAVFYVYRAEKWLNDQLKSCEDREKEKISVALEEARGKAELGIIAHRFAPEHITKRVKFIPHLTKYESFPEDEPLFGDI